MQIVLHPRIRKLKELIGQPKTKDKIGQGWSLRCMILSGNKVLLEEAHVYIVTLCIKPVAATYDDCKMFSSIMSEIGLKPSVYPQR